ncbi:MAG: class I SAM-dependent methyltransferase [Deltaproteobacteria bacterium]|nr:class I SAM-dependent methyltransferase [Deltaproteobacteria bacterium]
MKNDKTYNSSHSSTFHLDNHMSRMESPDRAAWQKPEEVITYLALPARSVVCEIGAGPGYFTLRLAKAVGDSGLVYAVEIEPQVLAVLRDRLNAAQVSNVVPVLGLANDPLVPKKMFDCVFLVNTFHHFSDLVGYLKKLKLLLHRGGRIVNIDFHKKPTPMGPPLEARLSCDEFIKLAEDAGLQVLAEHDLLEYQYFVELICTDLD